MQVTVLIENTCCPGTEGMTAEHGLSLYIEHAGTHLLFDTGASGAFADNACCLGIDLAAVDLVVLSHHHFDHGGGLRRFLEINPSAPIYLRGPHVVDGFFRWFRKERYIGLDHALLREHAHRLRFVTADTEILPGITILTAIDRGYPEPRGNRHIHTVRDGRRVPDDFSHELVLVLHAPDGAVVFTGCSHQGILNMIAAVTRSFPGSVIKAVFGGFHLLRPRLFNAMADSRLGVKQIAHELLRFPVERVYTGHCTGPRAYDVLKSVMGSRLEYIGTGRCVTV